LIVFLFTNLSLAANEVRDNPNFKLSLFQEPKNLDPQLTSSASSNYLLQNLHRNLLQFDNIQGLKPDLAEKCEWKNSKKLACTISKDAKWSDGSSISCSDFIRAYNVLLKNPLAATSAQVLFSIQNAKNIFLHLKKTEDLGILCASDKKIEFLFTEADPEFEYNLTRTSLAPRPPLDENKPREIDFLSSGPYKVKNWTKNIKIEIEKNPFYKNGNLQRPNVEFYFIVEDFTALQFYQKNKLDFLRRLPVSLYPEWKDKKDFLPVEVLRFDYYGFSSKISQLEQRKLLLHSLDFDDLKKIYNSGGTPGCAPLPTDFFENKQIPCAKMDSKIIQSLLPKMKPWPSDFSFAYSTQGGDDPRRLSEWLQSQWKKNLKLDIKIKSFENKIFISELKKNQLSVFRKGVSVDRPTCLAALEIFTKDHPENYIQLNDPAFEKIVLQLKSAKRDSQKKKLCGQGVQHLIDQALLIPAGRFDFFTLLNPKLQGFKLNWLNQMDLSGIHWK